MTRLPSRTDATTLAGRIVSSFFVVLLLFLAEYANAVSDSYDLSYRLSFDPDSKTALGRISLGNHGGKVKSINFRVGAAYSEIDADGELEVADGRAVWVPPANGGSFRYRVAIEERRDDHSYRSYFPGDWAVFRGDRVFPPGIVRSIKGAESRARLIFDIPDDWHASAPYRPAADGSFLVNRNGRKFDRPVGWMMVGKLGTRSEDIAGSRVVVAAPKGVAMRRMDMLAFLNYALPAMRKAFGPLPPKLLIVGAPDPMWRGGLSAPRSLYLHVDRPMISENSTSTLIHELTHVITGIHGAADNDDWIAEGIAEFYAVDILHRTGGMTDKRLGKVKAHLRTWSKSVVTLRHEQSDGPVTARAVLLLMALDEEIARLTHGQKDLDDLTRALRKRGDVSTKQFRHIAEEIAGGPLETLDTSLLRAD
jgi:hypothetical protein